MNKDKPKADMSTWRTPTYTKCRWRLSVNHQSAVGIMQREPDELDRAAKRSSMDPWHHATEVQTGVSGKMKQYGRLLIAAR